jgi:hypothetical protein
MYPEAAATTGHEGIRADERVLLASALQSIHELNVRCLQLLQRLALRPAGSMQGLLGALARDVELLSPEAISDAARQPFLLIDFAFGSPQQFKSLLASEALIQPLPVSANPLPAADASALGRAALIIAQAICRHHPSHAGLLVGLHSSLLAPLSELRMPDLERLAESNPHHVRIRWGDRIDVWSRLLNAASSQDQGAKEQFRMYGIQLMAAATSGTETCLAAQPFLHANAQC